MASKGFGIAAGPAGPAIPGAQKTVFGSSPASSPSPPPGYSIGVSRAPGTGSSFSSPPSGVSFGASRPSTPPGNSSGASRPLGSAGSFPSPPPGNSFGASRPLESRASFPSPPPGNSPGGPRTPRSPASFPSPPGNSFGASRPLGTAASFPSPPGNYLGPSRPPGSATTSFSLLPGEVNSRRNTTATQQLQPRQRPQGVVAFVSTSPLDYNLSKRTSSLLSAHHGVEPRETNHDIGTNNRRLVTYTDKWLENRNAETSKRMRSPPPQFESYHSPQNLDPPHVIKKPNLIPPMPGSRQQSPVNNAQSRTSQRFHPAVPYSDANHSETVFPSKSVHLDGPKRARSPPPYLSDASGLSSVELLVEREKQAKAKRLARFSVELSRSTENIDLIATTQRAASKQNKISLAEHNTVEPLNEASAGNSVDLEVAESSVVTGLCPDMCPESEREERERKGDLDKYERLDGERNQTAKFLAVKKYNRTAEREAELIRPLPVLQKTVDYLLSLLNHPYDESFLTIYNFLWDRMRAIRMDLRMQHIFNQAAISMLEQMIRLHIIAMHELCEYSRGEGFSEGFDAHLNIEQMNKTSVELFQMYDDHRRRGITMPTEKEFRGYYALLKLDKHPGYKVEPAELSLDLAKMSPDIRCSQEVLFAREVARACRIGNFVAFFRLARKATYLQACLMHAHFAKLRTQALASLHSGLQNSQGIPVTQVIDWLGLEEEDIEGLLEYHGFALRKYEELYLVKEGPFLNNDSDFPTKCSQLVHRKKSQSIVGDVCSVPMPVLGLNRDMSSHMEKVAHQKAGRSESEIAINFPDDDMLDNNQTEDVTPSQARYLPQELLPSNLTAESDDDLMAEVIALDSVQIMENSITSHKQQDEAEMPIDDASMDESILPNLELDLVQVETPQHAPSICNTEYSNSPRNITQSLNYVISAPTSPKKNVLPSAKLKSILRRWKQQAAERRLWRERKEALATAAFSSLSLGPPVRQTASISKYASGDLDIDLATKERYAWQGKSWSGLDISKVVAPVLSEKNPDVKCLCWKLLLLIQPGTSNNLASRWLLKKLMDPGREEKHLVVSYPHLSIQRKWICGSLMGASETCCLSIIRASDQSATDNSCFPGSSCIMLMVSESIPWEVQRARLDNLLLSIPSGSNLPLLIASSDACKEGYAEASHTIIVRLGLTQADKTKISSVDVVFLADGCLEDRLNSFFDDIALTKGLKWLANHSPLQPVVNVVQTRELLLSYLRPALEALDSRDPSEVGSDHCISAFNGALDRLAKEIIDAASVNPISWPSLEIELLEKSSTERRFAEMFLPSIGWNSPPRIEALLAAIRSCKLPVFDDISWLNQGSYMGRQIQNQASALGECLIRYLTQSTKLCNLAQAMMEARMMVQKNVSLELRGSCHYIVPRWVTIFRRIYNWRLLKMATGEFSVAYVLDRHPYETTTSMDSPFTSSLEAYHESMNPVPNDLSLDEIVEISCNLPVVGKPLLELVPEHLPSVVVHEEKQAADSGGVEKNGFDETADDGWNRNGLTEAMMFKDDRFTMLLERCRKLQDMIDEKLAIYF